MHRIHKDDLDFFFNVSNSSYCLPHNAEAKLWWLSLPFSHWNLFLQSTSTMLQSLAGKHGRDCTSGSVQAWPPNWDGRRSFLTRNWGQKNKNLWCVNGRFFPVPYQLCWNRTTMMGHASLSPHLLAWLPLTRSENWAGENMYFWNFLLLNIQEQYLKLICFSFPKSEPTLQNTSVECC